MSQKVSGAEIYLLLRKLNEQTFLIGRIPSQMAKLYDRDGKGSLTFWEFEYMINSLLGTSYQRDIIQEVWKLILSKYQFQQVTGQMLDSVLYKLGKIDQDPTPPKQLNNQPNNTSQLSLNSSSRPYGVRSPELIYKVITKTMQLNQTTIQDTFGLFDQDNDKYLNQNELRDFFFNMVPTLTQQEFAYVLTDLSSGQPQTAQTTIYQLQKKIQSGTAFENSRKLQEKDQAQVKIKKPIFSEKKPIIPAIQQPIVPIQQPVQQRQIQIQQAPPKLAIPQLQTQTQQSIKNSILESNIWENQSNTNILNSNIKFEDYYVIDQNTPGLKQFVELFQQLKVKGICYQDDKFPANAKSLGDQLTKKVESWSRPSTIWKNKPFDFFMKKNTTQRVGLGKWISPSDIQQGELGDCYFLASVSSIACRRPDVILDLFVTQRVNPYGIYCVRINCDGEWRSIVVDDFFPVKYGRPIFTTSKNQDIWVMVLEKAWAKIFGSYSKIEAGLPRYETFLLEYQREVLRALSGAPTKTISTSDKDFLIDLEECAKQKCIMVSGSYSQGEQVGITTSMIKNCGLIPGHAYSILKIKEINHPKKGKKPVGGEGVEVNSIIFIILSGDWSDKSPLWTPELKQQLKVDQNNEGIFFMDVLSFMQHFSDIQVCYMKPKYQYRSLQIVSDNRHSVYLAIHVRTQGEYYFTVCQKNKRFGELKYSAVRLVLGQRVEKGKFKFVNSFNKPDREVWCTNVLTEGIYIVQIKVNWPTEDSFIFSSYGPDLVGIKQYERIKEFIPSIYLDRAIKNQTKKTYEQYGESKIKKCQEFMLAEGHGYIYFENYSEKFLDTTLTFENPSGIKLCKPERGFTLKVKLSPGQTYLAVLTVSAKGYSYVIQEKLLIRKV